MPKAPKIHLDQEFLDYLNDLRKSEGLPEITWLQQVILSGAREGTKYEELSKAYNQPVSTLKQRGPGIFGWLSQLPGMHKVTKSNFKLVYPEILTLAKEHLSSQAPLQAFAGSVPSVSGGFYGRNGELEKLGKLLRYPGSIIVLSGMNGVGRRTLVSQCLQHAQRQLVGSQVIWVHPSYKGLLQKIYSLLDVDEQNLSALLEKGRYIFVLENGESFKEDPQCIDFLQMVQHFDNQAIIVSTVPFRLSFATDFPLSGLPLEEAMLIVKEFELDGRWWEQVVESLGGNPGFIRQYLSLVTTALGVHHKDLILRNTVQLSVVEPFLDGLLQSLSPEELELLRFIAQSEESPSLADILHKYPSQILKVEELFHRGLLEKRIIVQRGRVPKDGRKPVYMVPGVLKKYILGQDT